MNSKFINIIAFWGLSMFNLWGQNQAFAPIGARWSYRPYEANYPDTRLYTFTVTKDTLLDGLPAREMACSQWINGQFQDFPNLNRYVHTNSDSVFYWVDNQWEMLFNFGALPGDTIRSKVEYFEIPNGCIGPNSGQIWDIIYTIDSIAIETVDGTPLRVQYVSNLCQNSEECWTMAGKIVERIGAIHSGYWWGQSQLCILGGFPGYFRCYEDDLLQFAGNIGNTSCDYVSTSEIEGYDISIFPNPTSGSLNFSFLPILNDCNFKIFDGLGHTLERGILLSGSTSLQLKLEQAYFGILYVEFTSKYQTKVYKIIKS